MGLVMTIEVDDTARPVRRGGIPVTTQTVLQPRRAAAPSEAMPESAIKRVDLAVANGVLGALYGSALGKMRLRHELSEGAYVACLWYQEKRADYERAIEIKGVRTGSAELKSKTEPPDVDSDRGRRQAKRDRQAVRDYEAAKLAGLAWGRHRFLAFETVVIFERECPSMERAYVRQVAEALMKHRQLSSRHRQGRR